PLSVALWPVRRRALAQHQRHLTAGRHPPAAPELAHLRDQGMAVVTFGDAQLHLDQFVIVQRAIELGLNAFGQPVLGYDQDRLQMMADGLVVFLLLIGERHNSTLASEPWKTVASVTGRSRAAQTR